MAHQILVVDDHPPTVRLIQNALEQEGFSVISAANGAECLIAVHQHRPDLVILDVIMPIMDGFQTLRVLRENKNTKALPVIILTIRDSDQDVIEGWRIGADLYLTKPFQIDDLVAAVKRVLEIDDKA
ncbi:MAG: response regulator [Armatimonadota bacterium]|nr:response regulator [Armatimonadota bacterium]